MNEVDSFGKVPSSVLFFYRNAAIGWLVFCFGLLGQAHAGCEKVAAWKNKPPYLMQGQDGEVHGIHADLIREALHRMGCTVRFVNMPWARAMSELQAGHIDMVPGAGDSPDRERFAYFSRPTNLARNVLFISKQATTQYHFTQLADVIHSSFRLGVTNKASYGGDYDDLLNNPKFVERLVPFNDREAGWKMILAGRSDGLIADELTGLLELKAFQYTDDIQESNLVISTDQDHVAMSKHSVPASFVDDFNNTLGKMIADGSYKRIFLQNYSCKLSLTKLGCD